MEKHGVTMERPVKIVEQCKADGTDLIQNGYEIIEPILLASFEIIIFNTERAFSSWPSVPFKPLG